MLPVHAAAHVDFALIESQQPRPAIDEAGNRKVAVVAGIRNGAGRRIAEPQDAGRGLGRRGAVEVDVEPLAVLPVLDLAGYGILLRLKTERPGQRDKEDVAAAGQGQTAFEHRGRAHGDVPGKRTVQDGNMVPDPLHKRLRRSDRVREMLPEIAVERRQELILNTGAEETVCRIVVLQDFQRGILQVLAAEGRQHLLDPLVVAAHGHEGLDGLPVAAGSEDRSGHVVAITLPLHEGKGLVVGRERRLVGMAEGILPGKAAVVLRALLRRHRRDVRALRRRHDGHGFHGQAVE